MLNGCRSRGPTNASTLDHWLHATTTSIKANKYVRIVCFSTLKSGNMPEQSKFHTTAMDWREEEEGDCNLSDDEQQGPCDNFLVFLGTGTSCGVPKVCGPVSFVRLCAL